jgi:excisionase family DNA binding protein
MATVDRYSIREAAKRLNVHPSWVQVLLKRGELERKSFTVKINLIPESSIKKYLKKYGLRSAK